MKYNYVICPGNAMFSGQIAFYADNCVADERLVTEYEKLAAWCPSLWERLSEKSNILQ